MTKENPMHKEEILNTYSDCILNTYTRMPVVFVKGKGSILTDVHGKKYLDFFPGWGVSNLGHCHPKVMGAVREQIGKLIHIPNNLCHPYQAKLAKEIIRNSFLGKVFFCNSGAEANEAAIKFARAFGQGQRFEIITTNNSFHGRTMGALTATAQPKHHAAFTPIVPGFKYIPFNDSTALKNAVTDNTVAVMLELIQGEGGINVATPEFIQTIESLRKTKNLLLIVDEVQTGMARTGTMFCYQHYGITPDVMCLAKALGGGLPIGAMVVRRDIADVLKPGMHGSTFAGSPLVCQAALGVFKAIHSEKMLANVKKMSPYLIKALNGLKAKYAIIKEVRGMGLMIGVELGIEGAAIFKECFNRGLIINCTQGNVLRIMPALNVTKKQIDKAMFILDKALLEVTSHKSQVTG